MPIYRPPSSIPTYPTSAVESCITERTLMLSIDPHITLFMALASGAAWLMMKAGLAKNALELKRRQTACPSCGKHEGCTCAR
jgi:hypothetical protein